MSCQMSAIKCGSDGTAIALSSGVPVLLCMKVFPSVGRLAKSSLKFQLASVPVASGRASPVSLLFWNLYSLYLPVYPKVRSSVAAELDNQISEFFMACSPMALNDG